MCGDSWESPWRIYGETESTKPLFPFIFKGEWRFWFCLLPPGFCKNYEEIFNEFLKKLKT